MNIKKWTFTLLQMRLQSWTAQQLLKKKKIYKSSPRCGFRVAQLRTSSVATSYRCLWLPYSFEHDDTTTITPTRIFKLSNLASTKNPSRKTYKMTEIAVIGDTFHRLPFSPFVWRYALESWFRTRPESMFGETVQLLFFLLAPPWQALLNFLMFQLPRTELSLIGLKSNFPHHDNCTNVWRQMLEEKRGGVGAR